MFSITSLITRFFINYLPIVLSVAVLSFRILFDSRLRVQDLKIGLNLASKGILLDVGIVDAMVRGF